MTDCRERDIAPKGYRDGNAPNNENLVYDERE
jgi:hypothetical protein